MKRMMRRVLAMSISAMFWYGGMMGGTFVEAKDFTTKFYVPTGKAQASNQQALAGAQAFSSVPQPPTGPPTAFRQEVKRTRSTWELQPPLQGEPGQTALAGLVLDLQAQPLANVSLFIEENGGRRVVQTDGTGRFLLPLSETGKRVLVIDGRNAGHAGKLYGLFEVKVDVQAAQTTVLPYTIWMPDLDKAHAVTIPVPTESEAASTASWTAATSAVPLASPAANTPLKQSPAPVVSTTGTAGAWMSSFVLSSRWIEAPSAPRVSMTTTPGGIAPSASRSCSFGVT